MIGALIVLFVYFAIAALVYWAGSAIIALVPLPHPFGAILRVILILVVCLICIYALLGLVPGGHGVLLR